MKLKIIFLFLSTIIELNYNTASAIIYSLPHDGSRVVGKNHIIIVPKNNTQPLEFFAAQHQVGLSNMLEANPGVDPYLPKSGTVLNIPHQLILPDLCHKGIIINTAEMRLYYYPKNKNIVIVFPVGIGQLGSDSPVNSRMRVERKKAYPIWIPTAKIHEEYHALGKVLPLVVPSGRNNPMGQYALYIGNLYAIHGTNTNFGIGLRVTHGCIRLRNNDIKFLFENVPVGTYVQFINEPVKASIEPDGKRYLEVHNPLSKTEEQINKNESVPILLKRNIVSIINHQDVNSNILNQAIKNRSGIPVCIN